MIEETEHVVFGCKDQDNSWDGYHGPHYLRGEGGSTGKRCFVREVVPKSPSKRTSTPSEN